MLRQKYKWYFLKTELYKSKKKKQNNSAWMRSHDVGSDWIQPRLYTGPPLCLALLQATAVSHQLHLNPSSLTCPNCKQRNDSLRYIEESVLFRGTGAFIQKERKIWANAVILINHLKNLLCVDNQSYWKQLLSEIEKNIYMKVDERWPCSAPNDKVINSNTIEYAIKPTGQFSVNDCTLDDIILEIKWLQWWLWDKNFNCFNV